MKQVKQVKPKSKKTKVKRKRPTRTTKSKRQCAFVNPSHIRFTSPFDYPYDPYMFVPITRSNHGRFYRDGYVRHGPTEPWMQFERII